MTPLADSVESIKAVHDTILAGVYGSVRVVTRVVDKTLDVALDLAEATQADDEHEKP